MVSVTVHITVGLIKVIYDWDKCVYFSKACMPTIRCIAPHKLWWHGLNIICSRWDTEFPRVPLHPGHSLSGVKMEIWVVMFPSKQYELTVFNLHTILQFLSNLIFYVTYKIGKEFFKLKS